MEESEPTRGNSTPPETGEEGEAGGAPRHQVQLWAAGPTLTPAFPIGPMFFLSFQLVLILLSSREQLVDAQSSRTLQKYFKYS